jgi:hypothetical protein
VLRRRAAEALQTNSGRSHRPADHGSTPTHGAAQETRDGTYSSAPAIRTLRLGFLGAEPAESAEVLPYRRDRFPHLQSSAMRRSPYVDDDHCDVVRATVVGGQGDKPVCGIAGIVD